MAYEVKLTLEDPVYPGVFSTRLWGVDSGTQEPHAVGIGDVERTQKDLGSSPATLQPPSSESEL